MRPTLFCDIDSTINDHWRRIARNTVGGHIQPSAWTRGQVMLDEPLPGAVRSINRFAEDFQVNFLSSRNFDGAAEMTKEWLDSHGFHYDSLTLVKSHHAKLDVLKSHWVDLYIDDFGAGHEMGGPESWFLLKDLIYAMPCPYEVFRTADWPTEWNRIVAKYYQLIPNGELFWQMARRNLEWWRVNQNFERGSRARYYDNFCLAMGLTAEHLKGRVVGEIGAGPFGGLIHHLQPESERSIFIDVLANAQRVLRFISWPPLSQFVDSPVEQIDLPDKSMDVMLSYNAIDHGWDIRAGLSEIARVSRECYIAFDCKGDGAPPHDRVDHYQIVDFNRVSRLMGEIEAYAKARRITFGNLAQLTPAFHFEHNWGFPVFYCHAVF